MRQLLLFGLFLLSACGAFKNVSRIEEHAVVQVLQQNLPFLEIAPDDPFQFDGKEVSSAITFQQSKPLWVVPSVQLPKGIKIGRSNNNVSICVFKKRLYLAFRTGKTHFASEETGMNILSTSNGKNWRTELSFFCGKDFREPFLMSLNDTLYFYCFSAGVKMTTFEPERIQLYHSIGDTQWSKADTILNRGEVHWDLKKRLGKLFLTSYEGSHYSLKNESKVRLNFRKSDNAHDFEPIGAKDQVYLGGVSETAFEFDKDTNLWAVTRLEDGDASGFGSHLVFAAKNDWDTWQFPKKAFQDCYMSPKMFRFQNELFLIARRQRGKRPFGFFGQQHSLSLQRLFNWVSYSLSPKTTGLFHINKEKKQIEWLADLPGNGDTAFPSIQRLNEHQFLVANYSSPTNRFKNRSWLSGQLGKTGIYLQVLTFDVKKN